MEEAKKHWLKLMRIGKIDEATNYYWSNIHTKNVKKINKQCKELGVKQDYYDWLIIPAGLVYRYYELLINSIKPKKVFFVSTERFRNKYLDNIISKTSLTKKDYIIHTEKYENLTIASTYNAIREKSELFQDKKILIDMTAGKAVMAAGAGIMACFKGHDIVYINIDWDEKLRAGIAGTEYLVKVRNPFHVYGDLGNMYATTLFNNGLHKSASEIFLNLSDNVEDPRIYQVKLALAEAYDYWDGFNYAAAKSKLTTARNKLKQYHFQKYSDQVKHNLEALKILNQFNHIGKKQLNIISNKTAILYLLTDLLNNGQRRLIRDMHDDAIVRFYRIMELVAQHRLATYGILTTDPDKRITNKYNKDYRHLSKRIFGVEQNVPYELGLKSSHLLLFVMDDLLWKSKDISNLQNMYDLIKTRDHSFIAHGFGNTTSKTSVKYYKLARKLIYSLAKQYKIDIKEIEQKLTFVSLEG